MVTKKLSAGDAVRVQCRLISHGARCFSRGLRLRYGSIANAWKFGLDTSGLGYSAGGICQLSWYLCKTFIFQSAFIIADGNVFRRSFLGFDSAYPN